MLGSSASPSSFQSDADVSASVSADVICSSIPSLSPSPFVKVPQSIAEVHWDFHRRHDLGQPTASHFISKSNVKG